MTEILRWWRDLGKEKRKEIMTEKGISVMTYELIKTIYNETENSSFRNKHQ